MPAALARISAASSARVAGSRRLESSTPGIAGSLANITAAATTGPASGPTPASSTPAMSRTPDCHSTRSKLSIASRRTRSACSRSKRAVSVLYRRCAPSRESRRRRVSRCGDTGLPAPRYFLRISSSEILALAVATSVPVTVAQRAERNRIAQLPRRRNMMLPLPADFALHHIGRARRKHELDRDPATLLLRIRTKPHARHPCQRNADDDFEMRRIAVPADRRPRPVLGDQRVYKFSWREPSPTGNTIAQRHEKRGKRAPWIYVFRRGAVGRRVVAFAESHDAAP